MRQTTLLLIAALLGLSSISASPISAQSSPSAGMMRFPDVSEDKIVFAYANDLWVASRDGGAAMPLASPAGAERMPRFSPDGKNIAFIGNYDGGVDIYTVPTAGGVPKRMTFHPANETLCDWHPDGKRLIFSSNGFAGLGRQQRLFTVSSDHPLPTPLPVPYGTNGAIDDDGKWLVYTPHSRDGRTWKRYRGGMASDIWLFNLHDETSKQITDFEGTDSLPMWHGSTVYYLSDAGTEHRLNIWSFDTKSGERKQVTKFSDDDCKWPSIGPGPKGGGEIIFSNGSSLQLLDLATEKSKTIHITIPGDRPQLRAQKVDASQFITGFEVSPSAKRIAVQARGDIWTLPAKNGSPRNLTKSSGVAERDPAWSPDGQWIAYLSDKTGEYELCITQSDGRGETKQLTKHGDSYRYSPSWSPDSKSICFTDKTGALYMHNIESGETKTIDVDPQSQGPSPSWSHDSNWICYAKSSGVGLGNGSIWVYSLADGSKRQLTSEFFNDSRPTFDRKGDYIFFVSNRAFNSPSYEDMGTTFIYAGTEVIVAMPLRSDVKNPMAPKIDEESWKKESDKKEEDDSKKKDSKESDKKDCPDESDSKKEKPAKESDEKRGLDKDASPSDELPPDEVLSKDKDSKKKAGKKAEKKDAPFKIDFEGIERRCFQLPVGQGNFGGLACNDKNHLIFAVRGGNGTKPAIKILDLEAEKKSAKDVVSGANGFAISADGKKMLIVRGRSGYIVSAAAGQKMDKAVSTKGMNVMIEPRAEWSQIFWDAWRLERDFFYDPTMHGVDWKAIGKHYAKMLDECVTRRDVSFLIREMIAEINVGHAYYREGNGVENGANGGGAGLLGCRFEADGKRYKFAEMFQGADWDTDARNKLVAAGVKTGQYLLEINGVELTTEFNPYDIFQGTAGQTISITVSDDARLDDDDKRIAIQPSGGDTNLRFRGWIERKRKYVEEKTNGTVGYIYVINTGVPGQNDLVRMFYGQAGKKALIIDDRWNGGGQIPTRFIELLNRPVTNFWARRHGADWTWPTDSHQGPKCMLINGMAGSGGDMFPALFKQNNLGKLIGMRTWGGLVGYTGSPSMIDGSAVTVPSFAYYQKDGTWGIEGHGVDPDIKVVDDPAKMMNGGDPQLDAAIELMLSEIETNGYQPPKRPAYPDRRKLGIDPKDK